MTEDLTVIRRLAAPVVLAVVLSQLSQPVLAGKPGSEEPPVVYDETVIDGEEEKRAPSPSDVGGVYDPSLEYLPDGSVGWMAYSSAKVPLVDTHLATTTDHGLNWSFVARVNESTFDYVILEDGTAVPGVWRYEVPTLVYDAGDPGREWKVFNHKYFWNPDRDRMLQHGWIVYKYASDPAGVWSEEIFLFSAAQFTAPSYNFALYDLSSFHEDLSNILIYTEPGSLMKDGVLYLSLSGHEWPQPGQVIAPARIILLASQDHAQTWDYVGTIVERSTAKELKYDNFDGSALVHHGGTDFFFASPGTRDIVRDGTYVFRFADITRAELERSSKGNKLVVHKILPLQPDGSEHGGESDYDTFNTGGGIVFPQFQLDNPPEILRIYDTQQGL